MKIYSNTHRAIVEAPIPQRPFIDPGRECECESCAELRDENEAYNKWLSTHIAVMPCHRNDFVDGQEAVEGVHYRICNNWAVPIGQKAKESHLEIIRCPECNHLQIATIEHTAPWYSYVHECSNCKYVIMESEWEGIKTGLAAIQSAQHNNQTPQP
jgi:hypothetical protein